MDKPRANISQIRKYLNGELDAKAMHQLEREAQDDPFLLDALDGYEMAGKDQDANLSLLQERLINRTAKKERRIVPWMMISIAAGLIGFMIVVGLLYRANDTGTNPAAKTAQLMPATKPAADTIAPKTELPKQYNEAAVSQPKAHSANSVPIKIKHNKTVPNEHVIAEPAALSEIASAPVGNAGAKQDTASPMADMIMGTIARQKDSAETPLTVAIAKRPISQALKGKAEGVVTNESKSQNNNYKLNSLNLPAAEAGYLAGVVVNNNGLPMPGVTVKIAGKPEVTQTDAKGGYSLPATKDKETLDFSYKGYYGKKVTASSKDSLKVELNANSDGSNSDLNLAATNTGAHPISGWESFNAYVKKSAVLPKGAKTGSVTIKFNIMANGTVANILVLRGLSPIADEQAVSIIRQSGKWIGNRNGKTETLTKVINFTTGN
ncbi:hypothetical protein A0256_04040 [Mucilaginibacter sp. PAMC 26640]|nr:hypothetical protein A0256_04040 [Mucilaginibacter sp. PAMC 26640]